MRQIKFRGRTPDGEICYGDYCRGLSKEMPAIRDWTRLRYMDVEPESVAQLVGYAKDGAEVYEGDVVHFTHEGIRYEYKAQLTPCAVADNGCYIGADQIATREVEASL